VEARGEEDFDHMLTDLRASDLGTTPASPPLKTPGSRIVEVTQDLSLLELELKDVG
jgi:hypothetical protein